MTWHLYKCSNAQHPDWSERTERKDACRACCRSLQISYCAGPGLGISFEYIFMPEPLYTYYDYDAKLVGVMKIIQDWTLCFAHCNCVMSNVLSRRQINETFCSMTKGTYDRPNSFGNAERYAQRWNHSDHWRTRSQSVLQVGQTVVEFIEVFRSMAKCRIRRQTVIEHWPKADGKRCSYPQTCSAFILNGSSLFISHWAFSKTICVNFGISQNYSWTFKANHPFVIEWK